MPLPMETCGFLGGSGLSPFSSLPTLFPAAAREEEEEEEEGPFSPLSHQKRRRESQTALLSIHSPSQGDRGGPVESVPPTTHHSLLRSEQVEGGLRDLAERHGGGDAQNIV